MAFANREHGERNKVAEHIKTIREQGADGKPLEDQSLIESLKASVLKSIESLPKEFNGVLVMFDGRETENTRVGTFQVIGQKGHF